MSALLLTGSDAADYPADRSWTPIAFMLFIATDRRIDASVIAERALAQGLLAVSAWGTGCAAIEETFDELYVGDGTREVTDANLLVTTSHPDESLEDSLADFLHSPALHGRAPAAARVIFALGDLGPRIAAFLATWDLQNRC